MRKTLSFLAVIIATITILPASAQVYGCQHGKSATASQTLYANVENKRSDTIDILKYNISLEIGNSLTQNIKGNTAIRFAPKMNNVNRIRLDLLQLTVDSVKENNTLLTYTYNNTLLNVAFVAPKNTTDTSTITIYYKGQPQGDPSGWGGFYFDAGSGNQYAYNLGVGFGANPHNYGRVWFPCFDNFVERSKYEFTITSDSARRAYCNGQLTADVLNGNMRTRTWVLNEQIPTYLASVALAKYTQVNWTVNTLTGVKPITLVAAAGDTSAMKAGFVNLKSCINGFENYYGPYRWNRFGYCLVPFNSGAMEHATNIAYPKAAIGGLTYEAELMAHELAHHWWGDLITCETQEDMWINEGMATYSAYLFLEWQYGYQRYLNAFKAEHDNLLHKVFKTEGGFRAISGVPHSLTYGDHVYRKGADVAHSLRAYMGDAAFFNAIKYAMNQNQFNKVNSIELRDLLQTGSGQNLTDFFAKWVLNPGWPHFAIDTVKYNMINANLYMATVSLQQKLYGAPTLYNNVPLELSFFKNDWTRVVQTVTMNGASSTFTISLPFNPVYCAINFDNKLGDATSFDVKTIKTLGNNNFPFGRVLLNVQNKGADSSLVRIVHNFVKPDPFKNNPANHKLSNQRYWKVEGILSPGFKSKARFSYDGNTNPGTYISVLDTMLTIVNGDSVRLFYRADAADDWKLVMNVFKYQSGAKTGFIEIDSLILGEYALGNSTDTTNIVSVKENYKTAFQAKVFPNPAKNMIKLDLDKTPEAPLSLSLLDMTGKELLRSEISEKKTSIDVSQLARGTYIIFIERSGKLLYSEKILLE